MDTSIPTNTKSSIHAFTFDFKSLYDTISLKLVQDALREAMEETRSH